MTHNTPLRYPGGKARLSNFFHQLFAENSLMDGHYVEPYAGGAGIAFELLFLEIASHVHLNDIDRAVFCFWDAVLNHTDWLARKIVDTPVTIPQWRKQKSVYRASETAEPRALGFALFFLNRTNRSGILNGGVIGGLDQGGEWKIDARYNKGDLVRRIEKIASYKSRISLYNLDAAELIRSQIPKLPRKALIYFDPPYYVKGSRLYQNHYRPSDHEGIADQIRSMAEQRWIVSYDNVPDILHLYHGYRRVSYNLDYSASERRVGSEVMFFSDSVQVPRAKPAGMRLYQPRKA